MSTEENKSIMVDGIEVDESLPEKNIFQTDANKMPVYEKQQIERMKDHRAFFITAGYIKPRTRS